VHRTSREFDPPRSREACLAPDETVDRRTAGMGVNSVEGLWRLPNGQEIAISTKAGRRCMLSCIQRSWIPELRLRYSRIHPAPRAWTGAGISASRRTCRTFYHGSGCPQEH